MKINELLIGDLSHQKFKTMTRITVAKGDGIGT